MDRHTHTQDDSIYRASMAKKCAKKETYCTTTNQKICHTTTTNNNNNVTVTAPCWLSDEWHQAVSHLNLAILNHSDVA